jgi:glycerol-3-phosphate acyltransferase PlsY
MGVPFGKEIIAILAAYALGCFTTGYYLVRLRTGQDIRNLGSGNVGARNAGRAMGPLGFAVTLVVDCAKGMLAVGAARYAGLEPWSMLLVMLAVAIGHIWPAQLRFRGGKGIATSLGTLLIYDYRIALLILGLSLCLFALLRRFTMSGLIAIAISPLAIIALGQSAAPVIGLCALAVLILIAHRENIRANIKTVLPHAR